MQELLVEYDYDYSVSALEDIIDKWACQKGDLIEAFKKHPNYIDGQFMIAFDADYERKIEKEPSYNFKMWILGHAVNQMDGKFPAKIQDATSPGENLPLGVYNFFYYIANYAERCISESTADYLNDLFTELTFHAGQKTSRVVNKICCYLGFDKVDGYNREFAKYADSISPMVIKRHTILSLNPLDYLTMSFGNSWASCHTIDKTNKRGMPNYYHGCYSSGTISYMLDNVSMILYTVDAAYDGNEYWNQPKINRQMFHYGEEKLVQGRLYPQDNDGSGEVYTPYRNIVQDIVATIFGFPNLWTLKKGISAIGEYVWHSGTNYPDYYHFNNCSISRIKGTENEGKIAIGARPICVCCGCKHDIEDNINCCGRYVCADCGDSITDEDDVIWIGGEPYCRDCCRWCEYCEEYHRNDHAYVDGFGWVCEYCLGEHFVRCAHCGNYVRDDETTYIECDEGDVCEACLSRYYTYCNDCGEYYPNDQVREYDYLMLCDDCYNERVAAEKENEDTSNEAC
jgi:hypothetical protein